MELELRWRKSSRQEYYERKLRVLSAKLARQSDELATLQKRLVEAHETERTLRAYNDDLMDRQAALAVDHEALREMMDRTIGYQLALAIERVRAAAAKAARLPQIIGNRGGRTRLASYGRGTSVWDDGYYKSLRQALPDGKS